MNCVFIYIYMHIYIYVYIYIQCINQEIDYEATAAFARAMPNKLKQGCSKDANKMRHLRTLLTGPIYTQERLVKGKHTTSSLCPFCQLEDETVEHVLWNCTKWAPHRAALLASHSPEFLQALPVCTRQCGIILTNVFPISNHRKNFAKKLQQAFVTILSDRDLKSKMLPKDAIKIS